LGIAGGATASYMAFKIFRHIQIRIQAYIDPWSFIDGEGYQITQSLFALGRGGLFGLGLYQGAPDDIPYVEQDFIFSAIVEEMGLIFGMCLILICLSCFIMFMNISIRLKDKFIS
jgi:cell division protein FtsW (lipid II flippase)